jgi:hypothetical protein
VENIGFPVEKYNLLTTQKAIVNAIIQSKLGNKANGF